MESPSEDPLKLKKRGRPKKIDLGPDDRASSSSRDASAPPTPAATATSTADPLARAEEEEDPLAAQELAFFGVAGVAEDVLPAPPVDGVAASGGANGASAGGAGQQGAKRSIGAADPSAPLGRAKRPKNVKFSPAKGGKALARRSMATAGGNTKSSGMMDGEQSSLPNNDFCDACNGKGHFLCCDGGCLRSFHFSCLEPPLELDDVPDESWYCKACRAAQVVPPKPPRGYFRELIHRIDCENPKAFSLTPDIKGFYKNVATGSAGEFIDTTEHRPPGRAIGQEDRDGYRLKDKFGKTMLCYQCNESASLAKQRRIISCDFCEQHWHLDCLDPPMTGMPPPTRKWMCPAHASDHILPKHRQPKATTTIAIQEPSQPNNGDIVVIPRRDPPRVMDDYEELTVNRVRYQVPEETVILDFWGRVNEGPKMRGLRSPQRKQVFEKLAADRRGGSRETSPDSNRSSPLTSLGDLSDADPPEVATLGYSPYSKRSSRPHLHRAPNAARLPADTTMLDSLALIAEGFFEHFSSTQTDGHSSTSSSSQGSADTGLSISIPARPRPSNGGVRASTNGKGKGRAVELDGSGSSAGGGKDSAGGNRFAAHARASLAGATRIPESPARSSASPAVTPVPMPTELQVNSREDLKALMAVRKLMGRVQIEGDKEAVRGFINGEAIVPQLCFMDPENAQQPWQLPWESPEDKEKTTKALAKGKEQGIAPEDNPWLKELRDAKQK